MEGGPTCGQGLAEHSVLPGRLGELMAAMAEVLEAHTKALDLADENGRKELEAYRRLAGEHRKAAAHLEQIAGLMSRYRELPMAGHDPAVMASDEPREAFATFVSLEEDLLALLQRSIEMDRRLLAQMAGSAGGTR